MIEVPAELFQTPKSLLASIPDSDLGTHIREAGVLRIERRWVENSLPDHELLDAAAYAFGKLSIIVHDAHRQMGLPEPAAVNVHTGDAFTPTPTGRMPCMVHHGEMRALDFSLEDGSRLTAQMQPVPIKLSDAQEVADRYGVHPSEVFGKSGDPEVVLRNAFSAARRMFEKDGHHITIASLLRGGRVARVMPLAPRDQREKYLMMRLIAREATRVGADGVILISEAWWAPQEADKPYMRAVQSANREECLMATLVRREGRQVELMAMIERDGDSVGLGDTTETSGGQLFMFAPLYRAWGLPLPEEWTKVDGE